MPQRTVHDATMLWAIAHPVCNQILGELDIPANQASFQPYPEES